MAVERKTIHVVSNSHWDREWGYPFEETRLLLLQFMDELLDLLDKDKDFHSFTMDSQTLCVEDYLELRPEKRATVEKHVKSGRLIVGPWYSLPEEYLVSAESLVRNTRAAGAERVCVGLGVTTAAHAAQVSRYADGVIVGSALVRCLTENDSLSAGLAALRVKVEELAAGVRSTELRTV